MAIDRETLLIEIRTLLNETCRIHDYYQLYIHLLRQTESTEKLNAMNMAPAFFQMTIHALLTDVVVSLTKIYEERNRQGVTLQKSQEKIEESVELFHGKMEEKKIYQLGEIIKGHKSTIDQLLVWRDKHYTHSDRSYFLGYKELDKIKIEKLQSLILDTGEILNQYLAALENQIISLSATNSLDFDHLMRILLEYKHTQLKPSNGIKY